MCLTDTLRVRRRNGRGCDCLARFLGARAGWWLRRKLRTEVDGAEQGNGHEYNGRMDEWDMGDLRFERRWKHLGCHLLYRLSLEKLATADPAGRQSAGVSLQCIYYATHAF